jgi:invasion protein IalB
VPAVGNPAQTSATYGDWSTRCARLPDGGKGLQSCEIVHALVLQGQTQPIAEIAVGSVEKSPDLLLTVVVPVAISLDKTARIEGAPGTRSLADLTWRRCLPGGCYADTPLTADALKILRARTQPANLLFRDGSGHDLTLPFSMRGFDQALDALLKDTSAGK